MNKSCARCTKIVYPIEELKCLDKVSILGCWFVFFFLCCFSRYFLSISFALLVWVFFFKPKNYWNLLLDPIQCLGWFMTLRQHRHECNVRMRHCIRYGTDIEFQSDFNWFDVIIWQTWSQFKPKKNYITRWIKKKLN